jgi:DNA-binding Lrp family transcriptional regulator
MVRQGRLVLGAYIFIQTRVAMGPQVARDVGRIPGIRSSEGTTGPYDVIAYAQAPTLDDLGTLVATEVHAVDGITRTITCIAARSS